MDEIENTGLRDYLAILKRRKNLMLWVATAVAGAGVTVALALPPVYRSTATILIEQQEIPSELVRSTITSYADQRLEVIRQRVMTTANLTAIMDKFKLYEDLRDRLPLEGVMEEMRDDIQHETVSAEVVDPRSGRPTQATIAFTLSYEYESPRVALDVANELVSLYLSENLKTRTESTLQTFTFLKEEAEKLKSHIAILEQRLATFKEKNIGKLPELTQLNLDLMNRTDSEITETEREIRSLEERRIYLQAQLAQMDPNSGLVSQTGERILGPADRLKVLETEIVSLSAKYGSIHPEVVRTEKEIAALRRATGQSGSPGHLAKQLKALRTELATATERYSNDHPEVRRLKRSLAILEEYRTETNLHAARERSASLVDPDNPAYIQLQAQLQGAETDLKAQRLAVAALKRKRQAYEDKLTQGPEVEREYRSLSRDYESATARYQEIVSKQMEAQLAQSLETGRRGEKFTLIEPPLFPEQPAEPNRAAIAFLGLLVSLVGGVGSSFAAEGMDTTVHGRAGVLAIAGAPPLAVIPRIEIEEEREQARRRRRLLTGLACIATLVAATLVHVFYNPLDVLWLRLLRRAGWF
ncbi:MAG: GumC family protein [Gammaproteobacteria bacterium]